MTQQPISGILIICTDPERTHHIFDFADNGIRLCILDLALLHIHDIMRMFLIYACHNMSAFIAGKSRLYFMPIVVWIVHPDDWIDLSKRFHEFAHVTLLFGKLLTVQNSLIVTPSASFCVNAVFTCFFYLAYVRFSIRFHYVKMQFFIRTERFFICLTHEKMYTPFPLFFQFFHAMLQKLPGNSLILHIGAYPESGKLRRRLQCFGPAGECFHLRIFIHCDRANDFSIFIFHTKKSFSFHIIIKFLFSRIPVAPCAVWSTDQRLIQRKNFFLIVLLSFSKLHFSSFHPSLSIFFLNYAIMLSKMQVYCPFHFFTQNTPAAVFITDTGVSVFYSWVYLYLNTICNLISHGSVHSIISESPGRCHLLLHDGGAGILQLLVIRITTEWYNFHQLLLLIMPA